jgi:hypothetical protein
MNMPQPRLSTDKGRVVIYARYSSDQQRDASIEDQIRIYRARPVRAHSDADESWQVVSDCTQCFLSDRRDSLTWRTEHG